MYPSMEKNCLCTSNVHLNAWRAITSLLSEKYLVEHLHERDEAGVKCGLRVIFTFSYWNFLFELNFIFFTQIEAFVE